VAFSSVRTAFSTGAVTARARSSTAFSTRAAFYVGPTMTFSIKAVSSTPVNSTHR
jgi:hypothetical protein